MTTFEKTNTVDFNEDKTAMRIIDQTQLPGRLVVEDLRTPAEFWDAIYKLKVRGAPAIGVAASIALYLCVRTSDAADYETFYQELKKHKAYLASSRPTAVNLFWALDKMEQVALCHKGETPEQVKDALRAAAEDIVTKDIQSCRRIGEYGSTYIKDGDGILTHCNAGRLATVQYGTALAPIYVAKEQNKHVHVYADETRPLLQGARLTAFELAESGIETTVQCDNMAASTMQAGKIQLVMVGADRIAANGDFANKIGTMGVAILAKHFGIPFYVCAPLSTVDLNTKTGQDIVIEQRKGEEVTTMWYKECMAPEKVNVLNPAFDVTDHELVTGIITDYGIAEKPFSQSIAALFEKKRQEEGN